MSVSRSQSVLAGLLSLMILFLAVTPHVLARAGAQAVTPAWGVVPSPNGGYHSVNKLVDVAVLSDTDVWAAGYWGTYSYPAEPEPMIQHWDGTQWMMESLPAGTPGGNLWGISASATDNVWAVGGSGASSGAIVLRWDGSEWAYLPPLQPYDWHWLYDVKAFAPDDVWVVGSAHLNYDYQDLIIHWNGSEWTNYAFEPSALADELKAIDGNAPDNVWAVGDGALSGQFESRIVHWDGNQWAVVSDPVLDLFRDLRDVSVLDNGEVWVMGNDHDYEPGIARWDGSSWELLPDLPLNNWTDAPEALAAIASDDVWVVGGYYDAGIGYTLAWHWDGAAWTQTATLSPYPQNDFFGVDAAGANEVWAVGSADGTLVERWDGTAWSLSASTNGGMGANQLNDISAVSLDDGWAVGMGGGDSLTLHWDGTNWQIVPSPNDSDGSVLTGVTTLASDDAWAVGYAANAANLESETTIMHWDGSSWSLVPSPDPAGPTLPDKLYDVAAAGPSDIWAVGETNYPQEPLILHWDGSAWSVVPNTCGSFGALEGVAVIAPDDVWAVGGSISCHYDGTTWTSVPIPPNINGLAAVDGIAADQVWAVGNHTTCGAQYCSSSARALRWDGSAWSAMTVSGVDLRGVTVVAPDEVWAAGTFSIGTQIARWDGTMWVDIPAPDPGAGGELNGITHVGQKLWAVGDFYPPDFGPTRTLVLDAPSDTQGAVVGDTNYAGATVYWEGPAVGSTTTNSFGEYVAPGLPAGTYQFIAIPGGGGCTPQSASVIVLAGQTVTQDFNLCGPPPTPVPSPTPTSEPAMMLEPPSMSVTQQVGQTSEHPTTLYNMQGGPMTWAVTEAGTTCSLPGAVAWLSVAPTSGTTPPSSHSDLMVMIDTEAMAAGTYNALVCLTDDAEHELTMPISLTVMQQAPQRFLPMVTR